MVANAMLTSVWAKADVASMREMLKRDDNEVIVPSGVRTSRLPGRHGAWLPLPKLRRLRIASCGRLAAMSQCQARHRFAASMAAVVAVNRTETREHLANTATAGNTAIAGFRFAP